MRKIEYTGYVVRDTVKRQYLDTDSPRGTRWGRLAEGTIYTKEYDAIRTAFDINRDAGDERAHVVPIKLFKRI